MLVITTSLLFEGNILKIQKFPNVFSISSEYLLTQFVLGSNQFPVDKAVTRLSDPGP